MFIVLAVVAFLIIGLALSGLILTARRFFVREEVVELEINDEDTRSVKGGSSLLNILLDEGFKIPCPCGGKAVCFQCKIKVKEGGAIQETDKGAFSPKQLREGYRLSCQCRVRDSMKLELDASVCQAKEFKGEVLSNLNVATFIKELVVKIPDEVGLDYIPGDYLQIKIPAYETKTDTWKSSIDSKYHDDWNRFNMFSHSISGHEGEQRAYSMASYPSEKGVVKFNIRIATAPLNNGVLDKKIPWGHGSSYLFSLKPGDQVEFSGPFGESHMIDDQRDLYFLIGGAGSSFSRSHILDLFSKGTQRNVELWYGARSLKENIYEKEYKDLAESHDNFSYHIVLSEPSDDDKRSGWPEQDPIQTNYLYKAFEKGALEGMENPEDALYYVCGPPMHNISVLKMLDEYGVERESIILDDFGN